MAISPVGLVCKHSGKGNPRIPAHFLENHIVDMVPYMLIQKVGYSRKEGELMAFKLNAIR